MNKSEIEKELQGKGDFVKIDHLNRLLKQNPPIERRKFILIKLGEIYESKSMFSDAAKSYNGATIASLTFKEKIQYSVKEAELYIKASYLEKGEQAIKTALSHANSREKEEIITGIKSFYKRQAEVYEKEMRRNNAIKLYEKLLTMKILDFERQEIKERLMNLYEKTGKLNEYFKLKNGAN